MADGQGQAIEVARGADLRTDRAAFEPANVDQALALAQRLVKSGLLPRALSTPEAALTAIIMGRELGLTAMQAVRSIHVIEGKPSMSSALIVALVKRETSICKFFRLVESSDEIATYETHRVGEPEPTRMSFTIAQARQAGVTGKGNWKTYPAAMLRARCETALARAVYPDLVMGLYDPDELEPSTPRDVTPAPAQREERKSARPAPVRQPEPSKPASVVEVLPPDEPAHDPATGEELPPVTSAYGIDLDGRLVPIATRLAACKTLDEVKDAAAGLPAAEVDTDTAFALRRMYFDVRALVGGKPMPAEFRAKWEGRFGATAWGEQ